MAVWNVTQQIKQPKYTVEQSGVTVEYTPTIVKTEQGNEGYTPIKNVDYFDGVDGKSAYELAVINGFIGTETEWIASLNGSDGVTPVKGVDYFDGVDAEITTAAVDAYLSNFYNPAIVALNSRLISESATLDRKLRFVQDDLDEESVEPKMFWVNSAHKDSKLLSVLPIDGSGDLQSNNSLSISNDNLIVAENDIITCNVPNNVTEITVTNNGVEEVITDIPNIYTLPNKTLGEELIVNGDFSDGVNGWNAVNSTISADLNQLTITSTSAYGYAEQYIVEGENTIYNLTFDVASTEQGVSALVYIYNLDYSISSHSALINTNFSSGSYSFNVPLIGVRMIRLRVLQSNSSVVFSNVSLKKITNNQAIISKIKMI